MFYEHINENVFLDLSGLTESLFSSHKEEYPEYEQASLTQLYKAKVFAMISSVYQ